MANSDTFLALADFLIPACEKKPSFGALCSYDDAIRALGFRPDLREAFERALTVDMKNGPEPALEMLNAGDSTAFSALTTIVIATYYMNPQVRESIGYPGQENVSYDSKATQPYLLDGSLAKVIARGRKYRPTPRPLTFRQTKSAKDALMSCFEIIDPRFKALIDPVAFLETIHTGDRWAEGPVWFGDLRCLVWSDIPNSRMLRWDEESGHVSLFRKPTPNANGNTRDREGRLITCEQGGRRVVRTEWNGSITVLAAEYQGRQLNSPNDLVVRSDGSIWFTDPNYGIISDYVGEKRPQELDGCNVFRIDPLDGSLAVVADDFSMPNGIAFSPDESVLYVADSGFLTDEKAPHHVRAFNVAGKKLTKSRIFAEITPGIPDGLRVDVEGNVWISAADGVQCHTQDGELIGKIRTPEVVANLAFGGARNNRLFITATTSVFAVFLNVRGVPYPFRSSNGAEIA